MSDRGTRVSEVGPFPNLFLRRRRMHQIFFLIHTGCWTRSLFHGAALGYEMTRVSSVHAGGVGGSRGRSWSLKELLLEAVLDSETMTRTWSA